MTDETRFKIKGFLEAFLEGMAQQFETTSQDPRKPRPISTASADGRRKPFHEAILPHGILTINEFERSFSTRLGTTFEEAARLLALERFETAERGYPVTGSISEGAASQIEVLLENATSGYIKGKFPKFVDEVLEAVGGDLRSMSAIADLYLRDHDGNETFFEIKSPKPNKGQCVEATQRLLRMHAIMNAGPPRVQAFYAMAYNPWGITPETYAHSFGHNYLDIQNQVLIGPQFWDYVGGPGTETKLLAVYQEVGQEKGPDMIDRLALGY